MSEQCHVAAISNCLIHAFAPVGDIVFSRRKSDVVSVIWIYQISKSDRCMSVNVRVVKRNVSGVHKWLPLFALPASRIPALTFSETFAEPLQIWLSLNCPKSIIDLALVHEVR